MLNVIVTETAEIFSDLFLTVGGLAVVVPIICLLAVILT